MGWKRIEMTPTEIHNRLIRDFTDYQIVNRETRGDFSASGRKRRFEAEMQMRGAGALAIHVLGREQGQNAIDAAWAEVGPSLA